MAFNCIIGVWVTVGMLVGFAMPPAEGMHTTTIAYFHVPMAITMLLGFMAAAVFGADWLRTRNPESEAYSVGFAEAGFAAGLVAMATGMIFSRTEWGAFWSWDPQQEGVLATLLTYAALFSLRGATDDENKRRDFWAVYSLVGVLVALFGSYVFRNLPQSHSLHPSGTLRHSAPSFEFALWINVIGFALLMTKVGLLRARTEIAAQRLLHCDLLLLERPLTGVKGNE